jgi:hypothetical protein
MGPTASRREGSSKPEWSMDFSSLPKYRGLPDQAAGSEKESCQPDSVERVLAIFAVLIGIAMFAVVYFVILVLSSTPGGVLPM